MNERLVLRWRTAGLLLAVLVIVALPYLVTRTSASAALLARDRVAQSAEVRSRAYQIGFIMHDSESALYRLMAASGDDPQLIERVDRASRAGREVPGLVGQLRDLTRDNLDQQGRVGSLEAILNGRIALMAQALQRYRLGDRHGAADAVRDSGELFKMNTLLESMIDAENDLLGERRRAAREQASNNAWVQATTAIAQLLLLGIIMIVSERQISRRLYAEGLTRDAVRRSQLILQTVREPIALLDENLNTLLVNAAFRELYGLSERSDDEPNLPLVEIGDGAWGDHALQQRLTDVLARDRELWDYELTQRTADGVNRYVVINARRLQQPEQSAPAVLLTVSDVTARALVEQQISELNRQLEGKVAQISDVNRELEAFSYSVSHDLRAPLRHVAGFASKLESHLGDQVDDKSHHYIEVITTAAKRMAALIDDLLVFSRLGRGAMRLQGVDMQSLVEEARALAESDIHGRRIEWKIAPLPIVVGDENMLRTVWQNLIGNAVKYTGKCERAQIEVSLESGGGGHGEYEFAVKDNGAGFDMQYVAKLFGVFQRLHRASEFAGNGIGLANVRRIVARHGGRVWAEGKLDQGATFHFSLPVADPDHAVIQGHS